MGKRIVKKMFHQNRIDLQLEIKNHPILVELLQNHPQAEFEILLAEVARYCNVILHGDYLQSDIDELCGYLTKRLVDQRSLIILN